MKKQKLSKLELKKESISRLNNSEMISIPGGRRRKFANPSLMEFILDGTGYNHTFTKAPR